MHFIRASEKPTEPSRSIFLNTGTCRIRSSSTAFNISGRTAVLLQEVGDSVLNSVISKAFWTMKFQSDVAFFSLSLAKLVGPSFRKLDFTQRKATFEKNFFLWGWRGSVKLFMLYDFGRVLIIGNICTIGYGWISNSHQSLRSYHPYFYNWYKSWVNNINYFLKISTDVGQAASALDDMNGLINIWIKKGLKYFSN